MVCKPNGPKNWRRGEGGIVSLDRHLIRLIMAPLCLLTAIFAAFGCALTVLRLVLWPNGVSSYALIELTSMAFVAVISAFSATHFLRNRRRP
jgi:hypothetical protein